MDDLTGFICSTCGAPVTKQGPRFVHSDDAVTLNLSTGALKSLSDYDHPPTITLIEVT